MQSNIYIAAFGNSDEYESRQKHNRRSLGRRKGFKSCLNSRVEITNSTTICPDYIINICRQLTQTHTQQPFSLLNDKPPSKVHSEALLLHKEPSQPEQL